MLRTLDAKLHHRSPQGGGEYFGKDCGKRSKPKGQGSNSGLISTADYVYPCIIPYKERQLPNLNEEYVTPAKGDRPMHATTMTYAPVKPMFVSTSKHQYGGRSDLLPSSRPHACRSMHTSQIVLGREPGFQRSSTYSGDYYNKYSQSHCQILQPVLDNKTVSMESERVRQTLTSRGYKPANLSQYALTHSKLGAMLDLSKPKHEMPKNRSLAHHYNVLTGEDIGPSWTPHNRLTSGNRVLSLTLQNESTFILS